MEAGLFLKENTSPIGYINIPHNIAKEIIGKSPHRGNFISIFLHCHITFQRSEDNANAWVTLSWLQEHYPQLADEAMIKFVGNAL